MTVSTSTIEEKNNIFVFKTEKSNTMSNQNLIPINQRSKSEQIEISRRAGIASGEARREKKLLRERLLLLMDVTNQAAETTNGDRVAAKLMEKALRGDLKAIRLLGEFLGEFRQHIEVETSPRITTEEAETIVNLRIKRTAEAIIAGAVPDKETQLERDAVELLGLKPEELMARIMHSIE